MFNDDRFNKLFPANHDNIRCAISARECQNAVVEINGRFYITAGHCGFNTLANNGNGYKTRGRAIAASTRYER